MDLELELKGNQSVALNLKGVSIVISCYIHEKPGKGEMK